MDEAYKSESPLDSKVTVFRGFGGELPKAWESGIMLQDSGFVSTSRSKEVAEEFASMQSDRNGREAVFEISIPKGARVLDIGANASELGSKVTRGMAEAQKEVILPRGSWFKVVNRSGGRIKMDYVGNGSRWSLGK